MWLAITLRTSLAADQLADAETRRGGVVGDDGELALSLPHDLIDDPFGRADGHEPADQ